MPTYKNITLSLRSSAAETAPLFEYPPPADSPVQLEDAHQRSAAVYVPAMPKLNFWIAYHVKRPIPVNVKYFVFKLYMERRLVVTWGVGEEDGWKGKAMFGLFENKEWRSGLEKRAFAFGDLWEEEGEEVDRETDHHTRFLEVRVLRAFARKRVVREVMRLEDTEVGREGAGNVELVNAGTVQRDEPRRFYQYALRDTLVEPFAVFKYYYRTWNQLKALGVLPDKEIDEEQEEPATATGYGFEQLDFQFLPSPEAPTPSEERPLPSPMHARPDSQSSIRMVKEPTAEKGVEKGEYEEDFYEDEVDEASIRLKRLSFPPTTRIDPPQVQSSGSPIKTPLSSLNTSPVPKVEEFSSGRGSVDSAEETAGDGAMGVEWLRHTPSPVKREDVESRDVKSPGPVAGVDQRKSSGGFFKDTLRRVVGRHKRVRSS